MESIASMKSIIKPHFDTPLLASLFNHSVCCQVVQRLVRKTENSLILWLFTVKPGKKSVVQDGREQFVQRWQNTDWAIVSDNFFVPFFVDNFYAYSTPCFGSAAFLR